MNPNILQDRRKLRYDEGLAERLNREAAELERKGLLKVEEQEEPEVAAPEKKTEEQFQLKKVATIKAESEVSHLCFCNSSPHIAFLDQNPSRINVSSIDHPSEIAEANKIKGSYTCLSRFNADALGIENTLAFAAGAGQGTVEFHIIERPTMTKAGKHTILSATIPEMKYSSIPVIASDFDGKLFAVTNCVDAHVYEISSGFLKKLKLKKRASLCDFSFSDMSFVSDSEIAISYLSEMTFWNTLLGPQGKISTAPLSDNLSKIAFSRSRKYMAASRGSSLKLFELNQTASPYQFTKICELKSGFQINGLDFSPNRHYLAAACGKEIQIYSVQEK
jgi:WD40 repeat protein